MEVFEENMCVLQNDNGPLATLHEELGEKRWNTILRRHGSLAMLRNIFKRKMKGKLNYRHMSAFLTSSKFVLKVLKTVVMDEIDKISKCLMSSKNNYKLRKLTTKRRIETLKDCYMFEDEISDVVRRIFTIFKIQEHIGPKNCDIISGWVIKVLKSHDPRKIPDFVYKEVLQPHLHELSVLRK